ncbi:HET-domain-containing protein, partial [Cadophora sp. DSE1049]
MNTKIEPYQYQSIQDNDGIRLIQLQPSKSSDSIIRCDLIHTRLRTVKQDIFEHYTALSYVWGDATQTTQIMVGEKTLEVTKSLDSALRHLRDERRVLNIWADGVCINQNDDEGEKGRQVQQMGKVYETADHTVIFLGECDAKTEEALSGVVDWLEEDSLAFDSKINQDGIRIVQELLGRPWFTRVWVYQELVMSRDPWVQYGRARFPWSLQMEQSRSDFLGAKLTPKDTFDQHKSDAIMAGISRFHQLVAKRAGYTKLLEILVSRKGFGASDPRDLVFSILGLSSQVDIQADYGITTPDLYQTVAWNFMDLHWSLEILSHVEDVDLSARMPGLASWAPDWTA